MRRSLFTIALVLLGVCAARAADSFPARFREIMRPTGGAAMVTDPRTGTILAVWNRKQIFRLASPPGSAAKLITGAVALEHNLITSGERINCRRVPLLLGESYHCSHPAALESFTLSTALANSCNVFFVALSTRIDPAVLARGFAMFGIGAESGVDRPPLRIPSEPAAKARAALGDQSVYVTPAELLMAYSAVATRGYVFELHERTIPRPALARRVQLKPSTWGTLADGLEECVSVGTCQAAAVPGVRVAGKTGTAGLSDGSGFTHGWFVGYAPADAPEAAIVVFLPRGTGARDAAPLAGDILRAYFRLRNKP
jgi:cell division protein FtsI/penicillin-binding protein 2